MEVLSSPSMLEACFRASISLFLSYTSKSEGKGHNSWNFFFFMGCTKYMGSQLQNRVIYLDEDNVTSVDCRRRTEYYNKMNARFNYIQFKRYATALLVAMYKMRRNLVQ